VVLSALSATVPSAPELGRSEPGDLDDELSLSPLYFVDDFRNAFHAFATDAQKARAC